MIADLNLPDSTGVDTLRALRVAAPGIPIVVFSAIDDESTEQAAMDLGAQAFISKSALPHRFAQKIRPFLSRLEHSREPRHLEPALANAGETPHPVALLTERQRTVLAEVANGSAGPLWA